MTLPRTIFSALLSAFLCVLFIYYALPSLPIALTPQEVYPVIATLNFLSGFTAWLIIPDFHIHSPKKVRK
jgi:hypothetical protein